MNNENLSNLKGFIAVEGIDGSGKSTLVTRLHNLLIAYDNPVYSFSISDLCKTGHLDKQIEVKYEDIINFNSAREKVIKTLNNIKALKNENEPECILCYDKLMRDYFSVMRVYSKIVKSYLNAGFVVIADRWFLSSLAYNNITYGTEFNKLINYKDHEKRSKLVIYNDRDEDDIINSKLKDIKLNFKSVLEPDIFIYLDIKTEIAVERINKREKNVDGVFETKVKLDNVQKAYECILDTYKDKEDNAEYLFECNKIIRLNGDLETNNILVNLINELE